MAARVHGEGGETQALATSKSTHEKYGMDEGPVQKLGLQVGAAVLVTVSEALLARALAAPESERVHQVGLQLKRMVTLKVGDVHPSLQEAANAAVRSSSSSKTTTST